VKDVKNLLCDPARVEIFRIKGSNKYFRGLQYAKHKQRNMGKTLLACLLRFRDQTKTMEIVCKQVEDAICGILQGSLQQPSSTDMPVRAKTNSVTVRHSRDSIFDGLDGNVYFCKMEGDYDALLVVCVYCVVEHVLHAKKSSKYGKEVDEALRVDRILAKIYEQGLDENVSDGAALFDDVAPPETPMMPEMQGVGMLDVHDVSTILGSNEYGMDIDQLLWDFLGSPESMPDGFSEGMDGVQRNLESSFNDAHEPMVCQSEDWRVFFPTMECDDMDYEGIVHDDLEEFDPWELEQLLS
jgi:hypothetical protein